MSTPAARHIVKSSVSDKDPNKHRLHVAHQAHGRRNEATPRVLAPYLLYARPVHMQHDFWRILVRAHKSRSF